MKLYKKVVPYVLAGSAMLMTGCEYTVNHKNVIVAKQNGTFYLDGDDDGIADKGIRFHVTDIASNVFYDYAMAGDTLEYNTSVAVDIETHRILGQDYVGLVKINSYTKYDLERIQKINQLRSEIGQKKTRTL